MRLRSLATPLAVALLCGCGAGGDGDGPPGTAATPTPPARPPLPGTVRTVDLADDPHGAGRWAVRSWRPAPRGRRFVLGPGRESCLQVGRLVDGRLVRTAKGGDRELGLGDRAVCGHADVPIEATATPLLVERLADDPDAAQPRLLRTLVAGIAPPDVSEVEVRTASGARRLRPDRRTRAYLAVFGGRVRRADLVLAFRRDERPARTLALGTGIDGEGLSERLVPASVRRGPVLADPSGGPPFALTAYRVAGERACTEVGRVVDGEAGPYDPVWGSFLDAPTLALLPQPEDRWLPVAPPQRLECLGSGGLTAQRVGRDQAAVTGRIDPGVRRVLVTGRDGRRSDAVVDRPTRTVLAVVASTATRGERLRVEEHLRGGRVRRSSIATGSTEQARRWDTASLDPTRRRLRVRWSSGVEPFVAVDVDRPGRLLRVTVRELVPPGVGFDGSPVFQDAPLLFKCAEVRLAAPLDAGRVIDGASGRRRELVVKGALGDLPEIGTGPDCRRMQAGERLPLPDAERWRGP